MDKKEIKKMNSANLIKVIASKTGFSQKDIKTVMDNVKDVVYDTLADGEEVKLFDGLSLTTTVREARTCRNPQTGGTIEVPSKRVVKCKIGKHLKDAVNE